MKQVFFVGSGDVSVLDVPPPLCPGGGILVQTVASVISTGTESAGLATGGGGLVGKALRNPQLVRRVMDKARSEGVAATLNKVRSRLDNATPTGYSAAGVVVEVGAGTAEFRVGDRVACMGAGIANHAEYLAVPFNLAARVPDGVPALYAAFGTMGAIAMQGIRRANVQMGETVHVSGLGILGLLTMQILKASGCRVLGLDLLPQRVALAEQLGMDMGLPLDQGDAVSRTLEATQGRGVDAAIITASTVSSDPVNLAFRLCRERGRVVAVGDVGLHLMRDLMYKKELDLLMSRSYGPGRYDDVYELHGHDYPLAYVRWTEKRNLEAFLDLLASHRVDVERMITEIYPVQGAAGAYTRLKTAGRGTVALVLRYRESADWQTSVPPSQRTVAVRGGAVSSQAVRVALIGAGSYARGMHLPNLKKIPGAILHAVATRSPHTGQQVASQFGAEYCTTDYAEVLADERVDAVIIGTRHNLHKQMCVASLAAGKHVFVEKPMALTVEDCQEIVDAVAASGRLLTVGFNRRFSPFARRAKEVALGMGHGKTVLYRVNAGALPDGHWTSDAEEGGGRILGECCHFFDLMAWLTDAQPIETVGRSLAVDRPGVVGSDNLASVVRFSDGSIGTLLYSCVGHASMPKEWIEVSGAGQSVVIDDFRSVTLATSKRKVIHGPLDKGQMGLLQNFFNAIQGKEALSVTAVDGLTATRCAVEALVSAEAVAACPLV